MQQVLNERERLRIEYEMEIAQLGILLILPDISVHSGESQRAPAGIIRSTQPTDHTSDGAMQCVRDNLAFYRTPTEVNPARRHQYANKPYYLLRLAMTGSWNSRWRSS